MRALQDKLIAQLAAESRRCHPLVLGRPTFAQLRHRDLVLPAMACSVASTTSLDAHTHVGCHLQLRALVNPAAPAHDGRNSSCGGRLWRWAWASRVMRATAAETSLLVMGLEFDPATM